MGLRESSDSLSETKSKVRPKKIRPPRLPLPIQNGNAHLRGGVVGVSARPAHSSHSRGVLHWPTENIAQVIGRREGKRLISIVHHSVNKVPPRPNSLDSFDFAMRHQFRKYHHIQIVETASILHVQWDDDEQLARCSLHVVACIGHSQLSRPTTCTATM